MITTKRLIIRQRTFLDIEVIHQAKLAVWQELQRWMSWSSDDQLTRKATESFITTQHNPGEIYDGLPGFHKNTGDLVVMCGARMKEPDIYETGYWVTKPYLNQVYATEACGAVIRFAFDQLNAKEVRINHFDGNAASKRVIEKLGFNFTHIEKEGMYCHELKTKVDLWHYVLKKHQTDNSTITGT